VAPVVWEVLVAPVVRGMVEVWPVQILVLLEIPIIQLLLSLSQVEHQVLVETEVMLEHPVIFLEVLEQQVVLVVPAAQEAQHI
jgi:hypothetical protein